MFTKNSLNTHNIRFDIIENLNERAQNDINEIKYN